MKESSKNQIDNMTVLIFENDPSAIDYFEVSWPVWLFNTAQHVQNQANFNVLTFVLTDATQKRALAFFHLFIQNQSGLSPLRASFGSFEIADNLSEQAFDYLLETIKTTAIDQKLTDINIKHYPSCYDEVKANFIKSGLLRNGFECTKITVNQHITVEKSFEAGLHSSEKRRLRKCQKAGFEFEEWTNPDAEMVYELIAQNRQQLGYSRTFSLSELKNWLAVFPQSFQVFCVRDQDQVAALTLTVMVGEKVLYNFCPAHNLNYRTFSPAVMLTKGLYDYCLINKIKTLDLGVSLDSDGNPKPSLARFKQNLGAEMSQKVVFSLSHR
jgi:Acetyltransferase (GNAT) domain